MDLTFTPAKLVSRSEVRQMLGIETKSNRLLRSLEKSGDLPPVRLSYKRVCYRLVDVLRLFRRYDETLPPEPPYPELIAKSQMGARKHKFHPDPVAPALQPADHAWQILKFRQWTDERQAELEAVAAKLTKGQLRYRRRVIADRRRFIREMEEGRVSR
ncbi:hypothetical protein [Synoicihabitans lomoniglobus]|uniref:Uncharacterized protein n=1 Tax=Synoicihabitans lomoniglobus TaxID=2909285 RepID=A0AAF0CQ70_9BACT|nr:hypothetical protein [Opitutaceae bacterium LMO-M01]WED66017.1 hypothetical protein PXH66_04025 [Opitutaceae bacterium LMO-M01]